jgi:hypothetical protein
VNTYLLWFSDGWSNRQYIFGESDLHKAADRYLFNAHEVINDGETFMYDDFGVIVGGCYVEDDEV